jgi:asparagine synthetase B (glutamine-hydrolysing)
VPFAPAEVFAGLEPAFALHDGPIFPASTSIGKTMDAARADGVDVLLAGQVGDDWLEQSGDELSLALLRGDWGALGRWTAFGLRQRGWRGPMRTGWRLARAMRNRLRGDRAESLFENRAANFYLRSALETEEREGLIRNIRVEFPFCDHELAALLAGLRPGVRAAPGVPKRITREAMADRLPEAVRDRLDATFFDPLLAAAVDGNAPILVNQRYVDAWRRQLANPTVSPT